MSKNFTDLTGRVAVVTGGTTGLGRAIARGLAQAGADVVPSGRRERQCEDAAAEIERLGRRSLAHPVDVRDRASVDALRDAVRAALDRVDILVTAAGITRKAPAVQVTPADWEEVIRTNLSGTLMCCQSFYEPLKESGRGRIITIASLTSFRGFCEAGTYAASKAGVISLTQTLGCEWAKDGIRVNAIAPGVFLTDLNRAFVEGTARGRELLTRTPVGRYGNPDEVAGAAVFLASDAASFITGAHIPVDGGFLASGVNTG